MFMRRALSIGLALSCAAFLLWTVPGEAKIALSLGEAEGRVGETVAVPITLHSDGAGICATSADITFDTEHLAFEGVDAGEAASAAGKTPVVSQPSPGVVRIGVFGVNQSRLQDGVMAVLRFKVIKGTSKHLALSGSGGVADCDGNDMAAELVCGGVSLSDDGRLPKGKGKAPQH